jgi:hypothetical protein
MEEEPPNRGARTKGTGLDVKEVPMSLNRRHPTLHWAAALPVLIAFLAISAGPAGAQEFTKYRNYAEMTSAIQGLAGTYKSLARVSSIGRTLGGRDIWVLEIANPAGAPVKDRPALLVAGGFEGDHLVGGELALYTAAHLLKSYPADPEVKDRLDNAVVYVIPRVNPDGAEAMFAPVKTGRRTNARPFDDDNDGRVDEDGPEDLNKDGFITVMRVKAAGGEYMIDPAEPRLMKRADPKKGRPADTSSMRRGSTTTRTGSSTKTLRAASTSTGTSCTPTPITRPMPGRTWPARRRPGPCWTGS